MKKSAAKYEVIAGPLRSFTDLIGFAPVVASFAELVQSDRLPQVLLFEGRPGIGKRMLLAQLAAVIYCATQNACGHCPACLRVIHGQEEDLLWIETTGPFKLADAESVQEHLAYQANGHSRRVVVVTDIEEMTHQAANRLLKTLEEPAPRTLLLFSSSRARQLLPTIRSRLVRWHLQPPPLPMSIEWLLAKAAAQSMPCDAMQAQSCLERASLAPGQAWQLLQLTSSVEQDAMQRLDELLLRPIDGRDIQELQELMKQRSWKANELAQHFELLLNRYYKASLGISSPNPAGLSASVGMPDLRRIRHWRRILQQIYRAGGGAHNYLNVQLAVEAFVSAPTL